MATEKNTKTNKTKLNDDQIIKLFMHDVLETGADPKSVYAFCAKHKIIESDFYNFFASLDLLKQTIWLKFFENAVSTIEKDNNFDSFSDKNKLLTLYFTLFEILTLNRSYVCLSLSINKDVIKNLKVLKLFRKHFKIYITDTVKSNSTETCNQLARVTDSFYSEGAWLQFLFLLKFWLDDESKGFEKTDVLIEKSVNTVVDLLDTKPLESLFDLGKFLWKEKKQ